MPKITRSTMGLPILSRKVRKEIFDDYEDFIATNEDPTMAKFLTSRETPIKYWVTEKDMLKWEEMALLRERALKQQEAYLLERASGEGKGIPMAIFRLKQKQHGYSDRVEQDLTTQGEKITFVNAVPRPKAPKRLSK